MKKIIMIIAILLSFCSCSFPSRNFKEDTPIIFTQTETLKYNSESLKNDFIKSEYYDEVKFGNVENIEVFSYVPQKYISKYKINVFEVKFNNSSLDYNFDFFLKYKNEVHLLSIHLRNENRSSRNWSFAFSDFNQDGYFEFSILLSFSSKYYCFDSLSKQLVYQTLNNTNNYLLRFDEDKLLMYSSNDMEIDNSDKLITSIEKNNKKIKLNKTCYTLSAKNYNVEIEFIEHTLNFPLVVSNSKSIAYGWINTSLEWKGNSFSYGSPTHTQVGIEFIFYNEKSEKKVKIDEGSGGQAPKEFTISAGDKIDINYYFFGVYLYEVGTYNMKAFYSKDEAKEEIIVEDVFTIEYC